MKQQVRWRRMAWLGVGSTLMLAAAVVARSSDPPTSADPARDAGAQAAPSSGVATAATTAFAGARAFIDPATGKLTANPTRSELQRLALEQRAISTSRSMVGLKPFDL